MKFNQKVSLVLALIMFSDAVLPSISMALTSGPGQPEFSSFEPVNTTSMVNEFTGDFTYNIPVINIPGENGGGYAMSLSYHSGDGVESESSWVGSGWTLNPGAIIRGKRGFADDTKNPLTYYNDVPKNWTVSTGVSVGNLEVFSFAIPLSANASLRYNNYRGFGYTAGAGLSFQQGLVSLGYSISDGSGSFSAQVNPGALLSQASKQARQDRKEKRAIKNAKDVGELVRLLIQEPKPDAKVTKGEKRAGKALEQLGKSASSYGMYAGSDQQHPTTVTPYDGLSFNTNFNIEVAAPPAELGPQVGFFGNYNRQTNVANVGRIGYGYLYSNEAYSTPGSFGGPDVMDYYVEKEGTYTKRDYFLSIPFSNADLFSVTGEGLGGGFRLYSNTAGHFRPTSSTSKTGIFQLTGDIIVGLCYGGGVGLGLGQQTLNVNGDGWGNGGTGNTNNCRFPAASSNGVAENYFFRFNGDLGGDLDFDNTNETVKASIDVQSDFPGAKSYTPNLNLTRNYVLTSSIDMESGSVNRSGRSSYIGYHTNAEIAGANKKPYAYEKSNNYALDASFNPTVSVTRPAEQIGEISTVNEDGNSYVYGLPSAVGNEKSLQFDLQGVVSGNIVNNFYALKDVDGTNKMKIGQVTPGSYYGTYLLTQITTPDYVDRTMDGPTVDDFGGYTKFQYEQLYKVGTNGFHFRSPYRGLDYSKGEVSDKLDDMGSYSSGDKDIYLLKQIVTNTHTAKFYTSDRLDGKEAPGDALADDSPTAIGGKSLKKLDRIELWTNGPSPKLVKKVIFKYDYTTCKNVLNSTGPAGQNGKLTLKELWFEYDGIVSAKISPYKFDYTYPTIAGGVDYPTKYDGIQAEYAPFASTQNPDYSMYAIDAWGNYQDAGTGATRFNLLKTGVNQAPPSNFDPAAWQLKQITLPSGGQIHVQYEQDDYLYVQDKRAEALVSLSPGQDSDGVGSPNERWYKLNTADIGVNTTAEKDALVALIKERYNGKKIAFKFLYALMGLNPDITKCNSDYISGYVNFMDADVSGTDVRIKVGNSTDSGYDIPRRICLDLVQKQKGGKLNPLGTCDATVTGVEDNLGIKDMVMQLISKIGSSFFTNTSCCLEINSSLSYFKIPCLKAKKGGGIRVKRIMMYDNNGIDTNEKALYGTEYFYQTMDGASSGVATNEPASLKDENALITFLPERRDQNLAEKAISGTDREQFEGPIGESLLPAPSIGYSRVVAKSIHSGKTNTGFVISEFNTVKDFPFGMQYNNGATNGVDYTGIEHEKDWMNLPAIILNYRVTNAWASQGFRFILNSMHGQPKSVKTYSGDYVNTSTFSGPIGTYTQSSSTEYEYFNPGEDINVKKADDSIVATKPGKEMEVVYEMKQVEDVTIDGSIEVDFGVGIAGIIPLPQASFSPMVNYTESKLRTHVTSKVIHYPVIQKSVTTTQDGIVHKTENLVFGAYTGKPVVTKTTDGYNGLNLPSDNPHDGTYTAYTIPAYSQYSEFGQKAATEKVILSSTLLAGVTYQTAPYAALVFPATGGCDALKLFTKGDLIKINSYYFHVDDIIGNDVLVKLTANLNTSYSISSVSSVEIVRSGKTNQLNSKAGSYITYGVSSTTPASITPTAAQLAFVANLNTALAGLASTSVTNFDYNTCLTAGASGVVTLTKTLDPNIITISTTPACTNSPIPYSATGIFFIDNITGQIRYKTSSTACFSYILSPCTQFCSMNNTPATVTKVIASAVVTYDQIWGYDETKYASIPVLAYNDYETGKKGKWRTVNSYVYNVPIIGGATGAERNYKDAGTYTMEMFNWKNTTFNSTTKWLKANTVTMYSPNGVALEEKDPLDIYSSAKFGYNNIVPYIVAQNSAYGFCAYESFENIYNSNTKFEDGVTANFSQYNNTPATPIAHSGTGSYTLAAAGTNDFKFNKFTVNTSLQTSGLGIKVWVKDATRIPLPIKGNLIATTPGVTLPFTFTKVAQTGQWILYEAKINNLVLNTEYQLQLVSTLSSGTIYIDDVRQQPLSAQMNVFVYDPKTLRLVTSFDDRHFGLYYQYNQEGKLVRKMVETEKGMKTISETQYNTPASFRTTGLY